MLNMAETPIIFDRALLRARRARALALGPATFLIDRVADEMAERLGAVLRRFEHAADLGTPNDALRRALTSKVGGMVAIASDDEALPLRESSLDLVVSGCRQRHGHRHHALRIEAGIDLIQPAVAPRQQARGNQ